MAVAALQHISYYLPPTVVTNEDLARDFPDLDMPFMEKHTGIKKRHIANADVTPSDLAIKAALQLFEEHAIDKQHVDLLLFCTQSNDYVTPTTACFIQKELQLPQQIGTFDFNQGCTGYVYGLGLAKGMIETGQAKTVLLLTAETISRYINPKDKSARMLFGDAGTASIISGINNKSKHIGPFTYGSDGNQMNKIIIKHGGARHPKTAASAKEYTNKHGNVRSDDNFLMDGAAVLSFALKIVPNMIAQLLAKAQLTYADIDLFVFHQANGFILKKLQKKLAIPPEKFWVHIADCGNTVASTIPIALYEALQAKKVQKGSTVLLAGFGVGLSWASTIVKL